MSTLDTRLQAACHIVAKVIKSKFIIGAIGHINRIGQLAIDKLHLVRVFMGRFAAGIIEQCLAAALRTSCLLQYTYTKT